MLARLALTPPQRPVLHFPLDPDRTYLIGRGPDCDLRLEDPRLSRSHARLEFRRGAWWISDQGSKNGVLIDGRRVADSELQPGAWLSLGGVLGRYEELSEEDAARERESALQLRETTREMTRRMDPRIGLAELLDRVLDSVLALTGLERGFVLLVDDEGELRIRTRRGLKDDELKARSFNGSWGAIRLALERREVVVTGNVSGMPELGDRPSIVAGGIRALACVPLEAGDRLTGLVYGDSTTQGRELTVLDAELLESLCAQAAIALGVARVSRHLGSLRGRLEQVMDDPAEAARLLRTRLPAYRGPRDEAALARAALGGSVT